MGECDNIMTILLSCSCNTGYNQLTDMQLSHFNRFSYNIIIMQPRLEWGKGTKICSTDR